MKIFLKSGLTRISSATPSRAAAGGRYTTPQLNRWPSSSPSRTLLYTGTFPMGVSSTCPRRPGEVPKTTLPPEYACPTGVTSLDSPPRMVSTHTRSTRVAICASELMPTKYLKSLMPRRSIAPSCAFCKVVTACAPSGSLPNALEPGRDPLTPAALHPGVHGLGVADHAAHIGIESKEAVRQPQRLTRIANRAHPAHEVRTPAPQDDEQRSRTMPAEMLAQGIGHGPQCFEDVGVIRFASDNEENVRLREPVLEADARDLLHLLVGRIAAEVGGNDCVIAQHLGNERVRSATEGGSKNRPVRVDDVDVALPLVRPEPVDLLLEVGIVDGEQMRGNIQAQPPRIVPVEPALEVAGDRRQPAAAVRAHTYRVQFQRGHAEVVIELPQLGQVLHQR